MRGKSRKKKHITNGLMGGTGIFIGINIMYLITDNEISWYGIFMGLIGFLSYFLASFFLSPK